MTRENCPRRALTEIRKEALKILPTGINRSPAELKAAEHGLPASGRQFAGTVMFYACSFVLPV
jgi:hypothetical protein